MPPPWEFGIGKPPRRVRVLAWALVLGGAVAIVVAAIWVRGWP